MNLINIKRWLLFNRGLSRLNRKDAYSNIGVTEVTILFSVSYCAGVRGCTREAVYTFLQRVNHTRNRQRLREILSTFVAEELIEIVHSHPTRYQVTPYGKNLLSALENAISTQRLDRINAAPKPQLDSNNF